MIRSSLAMIELTVLSVVAVVDCRFAALYSRATASANTGVTASVLGERLGQL